MPRLAPLSRLRRDFKVRVLIESSGHRGQFQTCRLSALPLGVAFCVVLLLGSLSALETPGPANTANQQSESPVFFVHLDTSSLSPNLLKPQLLTTGSLASSDSGTQSDVSDSQPASSGED